MSDQRSSQLRETLRQTVKANVRLKYAVLIVLLLASGTIAYLVIWNGGKNANYIGEFVRELLVSAVAAVVVSLLLSLMYDVFTKREDKLNNQLEREVFIDELLCESLLHRGTAAATDWDLQTLIRAMIEKPQFAQKLIEVTAPTGHFAETVLRQYFEPLWKKTHRTQREWFNELHPIRDDPDGYLWKGRRVFDGANRKSRFLVAVTDDDDVASGLQRSELFDDILVAGKRTSEQATATDPSPKVEIEATRYNGSKRSYELEVIQPQTVAAEKVRKMLEAKGHELADHILVYEFDLPEAQEFVYKFEVGLSLREPIFYVRTERLAWIKRIEIDYSRIRHKLGEKVWYASFIGGLNGTVMHNEETGIILAQIDEVLLPGEGIALAWATRTASLSHPPRD